MKKNCRNVVEKNSKCLSKLEIWKAGKVSRDAEAEVINGFYKVNTKKEHF